MFRKSKIRIVAAIMAVLTGLFVGTLCVIYFSSYIEVFHKDRKMLELYAKAYWMNGNPGESSDETKTSEPPMDALPEETILPEYHISNLLTFFSVALDDDGTLVSIDNAENSGISNASLQELAEKIRNQEKKNGVYDQWVFHCETADHVTLVVMMDNTILQENVKTLFQYTLLFGSVAIGLMFIIAVFLAGRIVRPLELNFKKQKQYLSDAGHELKTPLAVILTNLDILEREVGENRWIQNIRYENNVMTELIRQLLTLARTENVLPAMDRVDLSMLITGEVLAFEGLAFERGLTFSSAIQDNCMIWGNQDQLRSLITVLIDNAIEHTKENGLLEVGLIEEKNRLMLSVSNTGDALSKEHMEMMFERFYKADKVRTSGSGHYGLGLAIAKAIVEAHKGEISVSCRDGKIMFLVVLRKVS